MMKRSFRFIMKIKIKGIILIELIVSIALISIILTALLHIVHTTTIASVEMEEKFENNLNMEYTLDFITSEIEQAEKISPKYIGGVSEKNQLGLILINFDSTYKYSFTTYISRNKEIIRLNIKSNTFPKNFNYTFFTGRNSIIGNVDGFNSTFNNNNKLLELELKCDGKVVSELHNIRGIIINE